MFNVHAISGCLQLTWNLLYFRINYSGLTTHMSPGDWDPCTDGKLIFSEGCK